MTVYDPQDHRFWKLLCVTSVHFGLLSVTHNMASLAMLFRFHHMGFLRDRRGRLTVEPFQTANKAGRWSQKVVYIAEYCIKCECRCVVFFRLSLGWIFVKTPAQKLKPVHNVNSFISRWLSFLQLDCWFLLITGYSCWIMTYFGLAFWALCLVNPFLQLIGAFLAIWKNNDNPPSWLFLWEARKKLNFSLGKNGE